MSEGRQRRSTAGRRMATLTGKALEDDEAFWGHDTWEEEDSGNDSFHSSDEDSEVKKDVFDSDFDDSESDREEEEQAAGDEEERELVREERGKKRAAAKQVFGGPPLRRKRGRGAVKRVMGDGMNAGIVLNIPGQGAPQLTTAVDPVVRPKIDAPAKKTTAEPKPRRLTRHSKGDTGVTRRDRTTTASVASAAAAAAAKRPAQSNAQKKRIRQRFSQEELLLEAARATEPENARWLLARKRIRDQTELTDKEGRIGDSGGGELVERFTSRRGYLNTVTFPEMDHVPEILTRRDNPEPAVSTYCVVTGERARYRDPLTGVGYFNSEAFREIRRRHSAGEPIDQRKKQPPAQNMGSSETAVATAVKETSPQPVSSVNSNGVVKTQVPTAADASSGNASVVRNTVEPPSETSSSSIPGKKNASAAKSARKGKAKAKPGSLSKSNAGVKQKASVASDAKDSADSSQCKSTNTSKKPVAAITSTKADDSRPAQKQKASTPTETAAMKSTAEIPVPATTATTADGETSPAPTSPTKTAAVSPTLPVEESPRSTRSPTRASPRRRKPSARVLAARQVDPKKPT